MIPDALKWSAAFLALQAALEDRTPDDIIALAQRFTPRANVRPEYAKAAATAYLLSTLLANETSVATLREMIQVVQESGRWPE